MKNINDWYKWQDEQANRFMKMFAVALVATMLIALTAIFWPWVTDAW